MKSSSSYEIKTNSYSEGYSAFSSTSSVSKQVCIVENNDNKGDSVLEVVDALPFARSVDLKNEQNRIIIVQLAFEKTREKKELISRLVKMLERELLKWSTEDFIPSSAEKCIIKIEHMFGFSVMGDVIQYIIGNNYDKVDFICGICEALMRYDFEELLPWGRTLLPSLIIHPSEDIKRWAMLLVDNWNDVRLLPMLANIEVCSPLLKEYLDEVVNNLRKLNECTT